MPGNEVGDRVHNFFGQENLSQDQHHSQVVDGNWPGLGNNLWVGSQRQIVAPHISNLKNYNVQQSDSERGHGGQSSHMPHGLNFTQSTLRPEFARNQPQNQQPSLNGYVHGHQVFQTRHNEANFLGVDTESDRHNLRSRGLSILESQLGNAPELHMKNSVRLETTESPINYNFFGGQQHMSSQHPNMMQSLPRQQSGITDMQLLQQQVMLRQVQEFQRQQQLLHQEARQPGSVNQVPFIAKQSTGNHSPSLINGIPMHDASNYSWQSELVAANTNWLQCGASPVMQGSSSGLMFSPEQGQSLHMMGLVPQQGDQSLYGVPISSNRGTSSQYSQVQMGKPAMPHTLASSNSLPGNQYETLSHQLSVQDGTLVSRHGFEGKNMFSPAAGQELNSGLNFENLQQVNPQQSSSPMQEFRVSHNVPGSSETSQEKMVTQVAPSQNVATLDPTEEKILFGSDDSLWDAFGRNSVGTGMLDGDFLGACPSVQSGSWSALMQSAVAETSSGDVGIQEEWSGLNFQNTEAPSGNQQLLTVNDRGKQQSIWADTNLQTTSTLPSKRFPLSDDASTSINVSGVQQLESKILHEQNERPQDDSSESFIKQFPEEASNWVDRGTQQKPLTEGSNIYGNIPHSSDAELNAKSISGSWTHQKNLSSYNTGSRPSNRTNGWHFGESISAGGGATLENHEKENSLRPSQTSDSNNKSVVHEEMGHGAGIWKNDSVPSITVELEHVKSATGSPQIIREDSNMNNAAAMPNSSSTRGNHESSQQLPNSHNIDFWKHADSLGKSKGSEVPGNYVNHLDKGPQILESSGDNGQEKDKKENSNDRFHSNVSPNAWLDASDSSTLPGFKQKSSGHVGRKTVTRKFQYHPMGDLDVDVDPYETKHVPHSQAMPQQVSRGLKGRDEGYFGQSKFISHIARNSMAMNKGDTESLDALPSKSMLPGYAPNETTSFNKPVGTCISNETGPSSQNMLELLHKVDQSSERGTAKYYSYSERNQSLETPETETSDGSVGHIQGNQSAASQGFALQLGPPSQPLPVPDYAFSSQSSSQTVNSLSSLVTSEVGEQGRTWLAPTASQGEVRNNIPVSSGKNGNKASYYNIQGNVSSFTPGFPYSRSHFPNQLMTGASGQGTLNHSVNVSYDGLSSRSKQIGDSCGRAQPTQRAQASLADSHSNLASLADMSQASGTNQNHATDSAQKVLEAVSFSQPSLTSGVSQRGAFSTIVPSAWSSISNQPHLSGAQPGKASNLFKSHLQSNNNSETTSAGSPMIGDQDARKGGNGPSDFGSGNSQPLIREEHAMKKNHWQQVSPENNELSQKPKSGSQGKESTGKQLADVSFPNPATTQRDIEAFGRSLRANNFLNQNYSLLHQVQATKNVETDPSNRSVKRFKGPDSGLETQQESFKGGQQLSHEFNMMTRDAIMNHTSVPSEDSKLLSFSSKPVENQDTNTPSQDMLAFGQKDSPKISRSNSGASVRGEQSHISPQMAPSWFDQYGTFKNGQNVATYDPRKIATVKSMEQPFIGAKPPDSLLPLNSVEQANAAAASQLGNLWKNSTATSIASGNLSSLHVLSSDVADQRLAVVRPKKRKSATCELIPWHKEVRQDLQRLQNISTAEVDWAQAANRLIEKVEDEAEIIDDGPPLLRRKRRLILMTQLMQQLLHPPPAVVLTADASSHYESVAYLVARSALGGACSSISASKIYTSVPTDCGNHLSEKLKTSERNEDEHFSKATEEIIERARKLENDLLRLDKRASIIDLRVECQDLEKFSVINRFAKFHSRGQAEGAETSSSSNATANTQKSYLQRYVTALPMPRNLPDRVQCHHESPDVLNDGTTSGGNSEVVSALVSNGPRGPPRPLRHLAVSASEMPQNLVHADDPRGGSLQTSFSPKLSNLNSLPAYSEVRDSTAGQIKLNNFDLNDIYIDSDDGMEDLDRSPVPVNLGTSSLDCPSWTQQDSHQSSPPQTSGNSDSASAQSPSSSSGDAQSRTDRIVLKLFGKEPSGFPLVLRAQILDWLSHSPTDIESYIRPGCVILTIYLRQDEAAWEELCCDLSSSLIRLLDVSHDPFWKTGWIYIRVQHQIAFIYNGQVVVDASLPLKSYNYSRILSVKPIAASVSERAQFSVKGYNLSMPTTRLLCALEGKYLVQEAAHKLTDAVDSLKERDELQCVNFSCSIPAVNGRGFIEVEDHGLSSSFFPFIVAEEDVCSEIRMLETALELIETDADVQGTGKIEARNKAMDFIHEMGWLLHKTQLKSRLDPMDRSTDFFPFKRFKWVMDFSMDHDWCAVVKKLLDILLDGTVDSGDHPSLNLALSEMSLLHRAVRRNSRPLVELLLKYVPEKVSFSFESDHHKNFLFRPDIIGPAGLTPLHIAAGKDGSEDVLELLTDDPGMVGIEAWKSSRDTTGFTPEDYARLRGHYSYIHMVQKKINKRPAAGLGHMVVNIPDVSYVCSEKQRQNEESRSFEIGRTELKRIQRPCKLCDRKLAYGTARRSLVYKPAMLSMVAVAAVCVCVALLFKSSPEVLFVFRPFRWEMLAFGTS